VHIERKESDKEGIKRAYVLFKYPKNNAKNELVR